MSKTAHIAVCIPSRSTWEADFAICTVNLFNFLMRTALPGYEQTQVSLINKRGSILPQLRRQLVNDALEAKATHLLFIDSDMYFPSSIAHHLVQADKDIIGCNCATKVIPANPTARLDNGTRMGEAYYTLPLDKPGKYTKVWRLGFGVMLIKAEVFSKIPKPWFGITYEEGTDEEHGEDWFFCDKADKLGLDIFVDDYASQQIGHIGSYIYSHDDVPTLPITRDKI